MKYEEVNIKDYKVSREYFEKNFDLFSRSYPGHYIKDGQKFITRGEHGMLRAFEKHFIGEATPKAKTEPKVKTKIKAKV